MKNIHDKSESEILRQKAEELLKKKASRTTSQLSETETLKLIHELDVHQVELEMQNEELAITKELLLKKVTDKYVELYDFAPTGYFTLSKEGEIIELNLSGASMLGIERSLLRNSRIGFFISDDSRPIFNLFIEKVFSSKAKETGEVTLQTGTNLPLYVHLTGIVNQQGDQCLVTVVDISGLKRAEQELIIANKEIAIQTALNLANAEKAELAELHQQALDRLKKIASMVPGVIYQYRLRPDGSSCFPYASKAIQEIYRVSPDEVREDASKVFANLHPDDLAGVAASIEASAKDLTPWQHEYRVKFSDGTIRSLYGNALPQREADGSVLWHGFITNVTDRLNAEKAASEADRLLRQNNSRMELAMLVANMAWWEMDVATGNVTFDKRKTDMLGYSHEKFTHYN